MIACPHALCRAASHYQDTQGAAGQGCPAGGRQGQQAAGLAGRVVQHQPHHGIRQHLHHLRPAGAKAWLGTAGQGAALPRDEWGTVPHPADPSPHSRGAQAPGRGWHQGCPPGRPGLGAGGAGWAAVPAGGSCLQPLLHTRRQQGRRLTGPWSHKGGEGPKEGAVGWQAMGRGSKRGGPCPCIQGWLLPTPTVTP